MYKKGGYLIEYPGLFLTLELRRVAVVCTFTPLKLGVKVSIYSLLSVLGIFLDTISMAEFSSLPLIN